MNFNQPQSHTTIRLPSIVDPFRMHAKTKEDIEVNLSRELRVLCISDADIQDHDHQCWIDKLADLKVEYSLIDVSLWETVEPNKSDRALLKIFA